MSYTEEFTKSLGEIKQDEPKYAEFIPPDVGIMDKVKEGQLGTKLTADSDLQKIADESGVPLSKIRDMATLLGGAREWGEDEEALDLAKDSLLTLAGIANTAGFQVPSWIYKKTQDEATQKAYDKVRDLVDSNKGLAQTVFEGMLPAAGGTKAGAKLVTKVASGAGMGATIGLTGSDTGEELTSAATGAVMSGGMAGVLSPEAIKKITSTGTFDNIIKKFNRLEGWTKDSIDNFKAKFAARAKELDTKLTEKELSYEFTEYNKLQERVAETNASVNYYAKAEANPKTSFGMPKTAKEREMERGLLEGAKVRAGEAEAQLAELTNKLAPDDLQLIKEANEAISSISLTNSYEYLLHKQLRPEAYSKNIKREYATKRFKEELRGAQGYSTPGDLRESNPRSVVRTDAIINAKEQLDVELHEHAHSQKSYLAKQLASQVEESWTDILPKIDQHINDMMSKDTKDIITEFIKPRYKDENIATELESWMVSLLNSQHSKIRFHFEDFVMNKYGAEGATEALNRLMTGMKKDARKIASWKKNITAEMLVDELGLTAKTNPMDLFKAAAAAAARYKPKDIAANK